MKRLLYALLCVFFAMDAFGQASLIPPTFPSLVLPASTSLDVYIPIKTSAYSCERVRFDTVSGTGTGYRPQNLYVYSWNGDNFVNSGIAWCRRDTNNVIKDTGYITVPTSKAYMSVGLIYRADSGKVYVIVSYAGGSPSTPGGGIYYDLYEWYPTGLLSAPDYAANLVYPYVSGYPIRWGFNRIKMDCYNLRKVVFAWDIAQTIVSVTDSTIVDTGGIYVKVLNNTTVPPFISSTSDSLHVAGTNYWGTKPDVAFADSGNIVRIAYYNSDTAYPGAKPLYVRNQLFNTIMATPWPTVAFNWDDSVTNATTLTNTPNNDHINIDCPDNYPADVWSVIFNYDAVTMLARTHPPTGPNVLQMMNLYLTNPNRYPAVGYSRDGTQINYGWFTGNSSAGPPCYVGTRMYNSGGAFVPPTVAGTYFNIGSYIGATPGNGGTRLSFSRQNDRNSFLFMAYPFPGILGPGSLYLDMRSKQIPWFATSMRPTDIEEVSNSKLVNVYPNPFNNGFMISISEYDNEKLRVAIADISGKLIYINTGNLKMINDELLKIGHNMASGMYVINVTSESHKYDKVAKIAKQ